MKFEDLREVDIPDVYCDRHRKGSIWVRLDYVNMIRFSDRQKVREAIEKVQKYLCCCEDTAHLGEKCEYCELIDTEFNDLVGLDEEVRK